MLYLGRNKEGNKDGISMACVTLLNPLGNK